MIDELHVTNVALIQEATIEPAEGLTVLTGETGTGKSALLSSVKLLVGERADASAVREGASGLSVEARLFLPGAGEDGTVVRRRVSADGRSRVEIDGHLSSVRELSEGVGQSIDLCGQHEHQRLLRVQTHVELLDAWAGEPAHVAHDAYVQALAAATDARKELERVREMGRSAQERVDDAAFVLRRIDEVGPSIEEYEELEETLPRAEHAEALIRAAYDARAGLTDEGGALDALMEAVDELRGASSYDPTLERFAKALESASIDIEDVASNLRSYQDSVDVDLDTLNTMQQRMASYQGLLRTYGPTVDDVLAHRERAAELVAAAQDGGERERRAQRALDEAERRLNEAAQALNAVRETAAPQLAKAISDEMAFLEMGSAEVTFGIEPLPRTQWVTAGPSKVELLYRPAAGMTARPLRRIASGGEVSRVMLAVKVVLGEAAGAAGAGAETLVFDEVDAGVGGATAVALAQVLARLAKTHQVIVVTHLAQVAVFATRHYLVSKTEGTDDALPETQLTQLEGEERVAEIARMLSGSVTDASLAHARELLGNG
ncbi:MAG: DNA repair protein RecN [Atopobiaceae bacterium]|nr:DNA repair protein RecN [Atopobiaceae bacterium]